MFQWWRLDLQVQDQNRRSHHGTLNSHLLCFCKFVIGRLPTEWFSSSQLNIFVPFIMIVKKRHRIISSLYSQLESILLSIYATIFPQVLFFSKSTKTKSVNPLKKRLVTFRSLFQGTKIVINILDLSLLKILIFCTDTHIQSIPISPAEQNH